MNRLAAVCLAFAILPACDPPTRAPDPACDAGSAGEVRVLAEGLSGAEGLAFSPDGRLFVSAGSRIVEVHPDGRVDEIAAVPRSVGIAWWGEALFVASGDDDTGGEALPFCAPAAHGAVWKVDVASGTAEVFALGGGIQQPNFLTVTPWGTLLVSDDCAANTVIHEVSATGEVHVWLDGIPSANGMAFDRSGGTLFVASTFAPEPPALWKVAVQDGRPGIPERMIELESGSTPDGIVLGAAGEVYVGLNMSNRIARVAADGSETTFAEEAALYPASLQFGLGPRFDACTMYATSLLGGKVHAIPAGVRGLEPRH